MKKEIIGKKLGMTQIFAPNGLIVPVTVVEAGPCSILQKKTKEKDGYDALKIAFSNKRENSLNKAEAGEFKKANVTAKRYIREIQIDDMNSREVGTDVKCDIFKEGEFVDVTGTTRGRGFTGVIQRWNQQRHRMTHGVSRVHRASGSAGANTLPARVFKGKKLAGQYGNETVTIQNLKIVKVDTERNVLLISGAVPGNTGSLLTIKSAVKA
jgi:large subunit ribosomal protein L3